MTPLPLDLTTYLADWYDASPWWLQQLLGREVLDWLEDGGWAILAGFVLLIILMTIGLLLAYRVAYRHPKLAKIANVFIYIFLIPLSLIAFLIIWALLLFLIGFVISLGVWVYVNFGTRGLVLCGIGLFLLGLFFLLKRIFSRLKP